MLVFSVEEVELDNFYNDYVPIWVRLLPNFGAKLHDNGNFEKQEKSFTPIGM